MRTLCLATAFLFAIASQGMAQERFMVSHSFSEPRQSQTHILRLPAEIPVLPENRTRAGDLPVSLQPFQTQTEAAPPPDVLHVGPVKAQMVDGHAHYVLSGVQVMGGGVSGTFERGAPEIVLSWPNN